MKIDMKALEALELKLAEYSKENGAIAEHASSNMDVCQCTGHCGSECTGSCHNSCSGSCYLGSSGRY